MGRLKASMFITRIPLLGIPGIIAIYYVAISHLLWGIKGRSVLNTDFILNNKIIYHSCVVSFLFGAFAFLFGMFAWKITKMYPEEHPIVRKAAGLRSMDYYISIIAVFGFVLWLAFGILVGLIKETSHLYRW